MVSAEPALKGCLIGGSGIGAPAAALVLANFGTTRRLAPFVRWAMLGNIIALTGFAVAPSTETLPGFDVS